MKPAIIHDKNRVSLKPERKTDFRLWIFFGLATVTLCAVFISNLSLGATSIPIHDVTGALFGPDTDNYNQIIVHYQRLPRTLIAIYVGAVMASGGVILQTLTRNPLASTSTLGTNAGASLFVVGGAFLFDFGVEAQGLAALAGAFFGFFCCLSVARMAGRSNDPRGLSLILSGVLVSMLFVAITNAFLLSNPMKRSEFLGWVTGNINHAYIDRLSDFWWIGLLSLLTLFLTARPLTLLLLGTEKAQSAGVNVKGITRIALAATLLGSGSAVAICGPVGFIGLIVPHMVRPFVGNNVLSLLAASVLVGAVVCLIADMGARLFFQPYILHTGLFMDLIGGVVFAFIVKRVYLARAAL
ncbi:FecCD family ABC transporter permease [Kiloniella sp. b19]|uniref:FecCD family ABC transporter permease n=1 Tax=Kiloniella sp. GXU_MW_B19 TaxID=3141326 RepID=UPI0031D9BCC6